MNYTINELGQQVGLAVENFIVPPDPSFNFLLGNSVRIEPISMAHLSSLYKAFSLDAKGGNWTYMPYGPFTDSIEFTEWAKLTCFGEDSKFYTIFLNDSPAGVASYLRIEPKVGCIEMGHIHLSPLLQRTRAGTEALLLMIKWVFSAGYRRLEWKCDALNAPSRHAAQRLGFSFEGIFRQATMYKSRNRDTAWYAITDREWPNLKKVYQIWKQPDNFDANGQELKKLSELTNCLRQIDDKILDRDSLLRARSKGY
ncbi:MAG: GNAT family N-acetyltransferase [Parachlamydiaceae bacterium]|nr:GNAT family N-acetyltransferase [Parachlamydiaceae bacterium]